MPTAQNTERDQETVLLKKFKNQNPDLFQKDDAKLLRHLFLVGGFLFCLSVTAVFSPFLVIKMASSLVSGFLWFCLINTTIHHHQTHRNAATSAFMKKVLDLIFLMALPNAHKRKKRYIRAHLNHHLRPFHETDVDHHYGTERYLRMMKTPWEKFLYFVELTFVGAHVPGWEDDRYMNETPLESWSRQDYAEVKKREKLKAIQEALLQWGSLLAALVTAAALPVTRGAVNVIVWGWAFPMLLVKNWAHFLGQFQHYEASFLALETSVNRKTKSFHVPTWLNYLAAGEISGHFLHHLYPEMPYYHIERARERFISDPQLSKAFLIY